MSSCSVALASDSVRRGARSAFVPLHEIEVPILVIYTGGTIGMKKNEDGGTYFVGIFCRPVDRGVGA